MNQNRESGLRRELGAVDAAALLIGCVLGSGVFVVPGDIAPGLPSAVVALGLWLVGALISVSGSICVARLAAAHPTAGGPYAYLRRSYGDSVGFMYGWTALVVVNCAVTAALAIAFAAALSRFWPSAIGERGLAIATIALVALLATAGIKLGKHVQNSLSAAKLLGVAFVIGVVAYHQPHPLHAILSWQSNQAATWQGLGGALIGILWTYDGWSYLAFAGDEVRRAPRTLRFGFWVGSSLAAVAVIGANVAYHAALSPTEMSTAHGPVALAAVGKYLGDSGALAVEVVILIAIFGSLSALFATATRCPLAMARDGLLPRAIASVSARSGAPVAAIILQALGAMALLFRGSFMQVLSISFVVDWSFKVLLIAILFRDRRRAGRALLPALWCSTVCVVIGFAAVSEPRSAALGVLLAVLGLPLHWLMKRRASKALSGNQEPLSNAKLAP